MANLANPLIGLLLLQRKGPVSDSRQVLINFPSFPLQLGGANNSYPKVTELLLNPHEILLQPGKQIIDWVKSKIDSEREVNGTLQPTLYIQSNHELNICPATKSRKNHQYILQLNNFRNYPYTLRKATHLANLSILTPDQTKYIQPIDPAPVRHILDNNHDDALQCVNSFLKTPRTDISVEIFWLRTSRNPDNPCDLTPTQKLVLTDLHALEEL